MNNFNKKQRESITTYKVALTNAFLNIYINKINLIKSSSKVANKISKNIYLKTKDMSWDKILKGYQAIV